MSHASSAGDSPEKRSKVSSSGDTINNQQQLLLPGLPDHVSQLVLPLLPPHLLFSVSRSWRRLLYTPSFPPFLSLYTLSLATDNSLRLSSFDPISSSWHGLPPPPDRPLRPILRHPSFLSRSLPIQSASVSGNLVLFSATAENLTPAFPHPLIFDPSVKKWEFGPRLRFPRRWCAGGTCGGALYIASGVGSRFTTRTARSVEKLDFMNKNSSECSWEKLRDLEREDMSREAMSGVGWRGKLLVANVTAKEGVVYDMDSDTWHEMPEGMIRGWKGPAASMDEEALYIIDQSKGVLTRYNPGGDLWEDVLFVPELRGTEQIAAGGGRVCAIQGGGRAIVVVDVVAFPPRHWIVDTPRGIKAIALHILPRISWLEP